MRLTTSLLAVCALCTSTALAQTPMLPLPLDDTSGLDLVRERTWLEWKVLRQFQAIYNEALDSNPDMNYLIAINTRYLGEAALAHKSQAVIVLVVKFFNTYLRATLNVKQVRTAYNIMNQYRQLVEAIVLSGGRHVAPS